MKWACLIFGHDKILTLTPTRIYLQCQTCAYESPGWTLNDALPRQRWKKYLTFVDRIRRSKAA